METAQTLEVAAGEVAERLKSLGIGSDELVRITIEPDRELIPGRREARARVVAAGLSDSDIDRLIKQAQQEVEPRFGLMRIVIDTNVLVSAALKDKSLPSIALRHAVQHGTLLKSSATERQALDVLARPYLAPLIPSATLGWISSLLAGAELVGIAERIAASRDPTDDKFLELAVNGRADFIISGDADLLVLNPFRSIPILSPAVFVQGALR